MLQKISRTWALVSSKKKDIPIAAENQPKAGQDNFIKDLRPERNNSKTKHETESDETFNEQEATVQELVTQIVDMTPINESSKELELTNQTPMSEEDSYGLTPETDTHKDTPTQNTVGTSSVDIAPVSTSEVVDTFEGLDTINVNVQSDTQEPTTDSVVDAVEVLDTIKVNVQSDTQEPTTDSIVDAVEVLHPIKVIVQSDTQEATSDSIVDAVEVLHPIKVNVQSDPQEPDF